MSKSVCVIGGGIAGLSSACHLAHAGFHVDLFEKNAEIGGRARKMEAEGFTFDMGPSWYWMPDVFERFFATFDKEVSEYYDLVKLDPGFRIYFGQDDSLDISADIEVLKRQFEKIEKGAGGRLTEFLADAAYKYKVSMSDLVYKPGLSWSEFLDWRIIFGLLKLQMFTPFDQFVKGFFKHPRLCQIMEFPILFLGASPAKTPAMYSLMNYAGLAQGTYYPMGGMHQVIDGMATLARELGVRIHTSSPIEAIHAENQLVSHISVNGKAHAADFYVSSADYHHTDQTLLSPDKSNYSKQYWSNRTMAPSSLLFYLGVKKRLPSLQHHNLFFDEDLSQHISEIYDQPQWPSSPLFYVCSPSQTDPSTAPPNCENLFILMPLAAGLEDSYEKRQAYFQIIINRLQKIIGEDFEDHICFKRSYCLQDFQHDYNAFKGNAYGLANTLRQTAMLKPKIKNRKLKNLMYTGHLTAPGPGVPPSLISGKLVSDQIVKLSK